MEVFWCQVEAQVIMPISRAQTGKQIKSAPKTRRRKKKKVK